MQIIKPFMWLLISIFFIPAYANPPFQVLRTCIDGKPYDKDATILELDDASAQDEPLVGCTDQYEFKFNKHNYGSLICNEKFYLIINDEKLDPEKADNYSINPEIKPGVEFTPRALWYKIDYAKKPYLCIYAPLSEQGVGSSRNQYYIIENAFDANLKPEIFFYFFDKNIAPITSKTL